MVMLADSDIRTPEVRAWKGLHLLHFSDSSCSQKCRIVLRLKGQPVRLRHVDLARLEHVTPWFMGINPRGLVPVLVHDGQVIIESNDIIEYLDRHFPQPTLVPRGREDEVHRLLQDENHLHLDLRALTMRFVVPGFLARRSDAQIRKYLATGSGTVGGMVDAHKQVEVEFWRDMARHRGVSDARAQQAIARFRQAFELLEARLATHSHLLGEQLTALDIAWYIYARRLLAAGYPLQRLHSGVGRWFERLDARAEFHDEVRTPAWMRAVTALLHLGQRLRGTTLVRLGGLHARSSSG